MNATASEESSRLESLVRAAEIRFLEHFQRPPRWVVAAPGRVNLIGEHTDYNDGFVLPMAIDRHTVIAADRPMAEFPDHRPKRARVYSTERGQWATIATEGAIKPGPAGWVNYVQGSVAGCLAEGLEPGSFEALIHSNVPVGGGLSSSAALEVAVATLVEAITSRPIKPLQKAIVCQKAENDFARMPCGIMDQFSSVMGRESCLMLLDCRSRTAEFVPLADPDIAVLVINSKVKRELTGGEYAERRAQCREAIRLLGVPALRDASTDQLEAMRDRGLDEVLFRRARHVVTECRRTVETAEAIKQADWDRVGRLMYASHASLRDDYEVSCRELDLLVELAKSLGPSRGVIGCRMTGGGFGGCVVGLIRRDAVSAVRQTISERYLEEIGIEPSVFVVRPARGAFVVRNAEAPSPPAESPVRTELPSQLP